MSNLHIHPLTPDRIPDFVTLFGPSGACYGCWCTAFLLRPKVRQAMSGDDRREAMLDRIQPSVDKLITHVEENTSWQDPTTEVKH